MSVSRRGFMVGCSAAIAAMAGGRVSNLVFAADSVPRDILVVVFLRGGCDALSLVAPTNDDHYVNKRLNLRVTDGDPSTDQAAGWQLDNTLDPAAGFRFHNKARPLHELYVSNNLAIVHACGLTNGTRSHFDAMDYIERGTPTNKNASNGWIARHLRSIGVSASQPGELPGVAAGSTMPTSLMGSPVTVAMSRPADFRFSRHWKYGPLQQEALRGFYGAGIGGVYDAGTVTLGSLDAVNAKLPKDSNGNPLPYVPETEAGKEYPTDWYVSGFKDSLQCIAQLVKMDMGLQIATVDYGGWDTHQDQNSLLTRQIDGMSRALAAFYNDMRNYHTRLTVAVISEFGRRLKANDSGGTDHGHGGVMMVMGGNVKGGRMYGRWPGLADEQLDNNVDLQVTTDFRTVLSEIVVRRLANGKLGQIFPGITPEVYSSASKLDFLNGAEAAVDYSNTYGTTFLPYVRR